MRSSAYANVRPVLVETWTAARPSVYSARAGFVAGALRSWPYALLTALAVGSVIAVGVNLSNAYPSEQKPFGWPGTATFSNGVAMVRDELVLAASLPALGLAFASLRRLQPRREGAAFLGGIAVAGLIALFVGVALGGLWGVWAASKSSWSQYRAFWYAHVLLAWAFYSLSLLACACVRRYGLAIALALFAFYLAVYDNLLQWRVFREAGFHRLQAGDFPDWFLAAQAASPISAYRGLLILGTPEFMDGLERAVLKGATLPGWATPDTFAATLVAMWIILPLGLTASVWKLRAVLAFRRPHAMERSDVRPTRDVV